MSKFNKDLYNIVEICLKLDDFEEIEDNICKFLFKYKIMPGSETFDDIIGMIFNAIYTSRTSAIISKFRELIDEYD